MLTYKVLMRASARKFLQKIQRKTRTRITEKIHQLGQNPDDPGLDIKPLKGPEKLFRLRIGDWRVIYARDDIVRIISIEKIGSRGDVYKH